MSEENGLAEEWDGIIPDFADSDYNPVPGNNTVTLGELLQTVDFDWGQNEYTSYTMSADTLAWLRPRLNSKINNRFYFRDIGITPVAMWKKVFLSKLTQALDARGPLYEIVRQGIDLTDAGYSQEKSITVDSDMPQARLQMEQEDYANASIETAKQANKRLGQIEAMAAFTKTFTELDEQVLKELAQCFSGFMRPVDF